jgi:hypothetical protein
MASLTIYQHIAAMVAARSLSAEDRASTMFSQTRICPTLGGLAKAR